MSAHPGQDTLSQRFAADDTVRTFGVGDGYSTLMGAVRGRCAEGIVIPEELSDFSASIVLCTSVEDVRKYLEVAASVSFKSIGVKGNASFNFLHKTNFSRYDCHLIADIRFMNSRKRFDDSPRLLGSTTTLELPDFYSTFGDQYIHSVEYGGSLFLLFTLHTNSMTEIRDFRANASGKVGNYAASISAANVLESFRSSANMTLTIDAKSLQTGTLPIGSNLQLTGELLTQVVEFIKDSPSKVLVPSPHVLGLELRPITNIDTDGKFAQLERVVTSASRRVDDLADFREKGSRILGDLEFAIDHPALFDLSATGLDTARLTADRLDEALTEVDRKAHDLMVNPFQIDDFTTFDLAPYEDLLPVPIHVVEPCIICEFANPGWPALQLLMKPDKTQTSWAGRDGTPLTNFRAWCEPALSDGRLAVQVQANNGSDYKNDGSWVLSSSSPIYMIGFWLRRPPAFE